MFKTVSTSPFASTSASAFRSHLENRSGSASPSPPNFFPNLLGRNGGTDVCPDIFHRVRAFNSARSYYPTHGRRDGNPHRRSFIISASNALVVLDERGRERKGEYWSAHFARLFFFRRRRFIDRSIGRLRGGGGGGKKRRRRRGFFGLIFFSIFFCC